MSIIDEKTIIKLHQYQACPKTIKPSTSLIEICLEITSLELNKQRFSLERSTKKEEINNTKAFFSQHFKIHKVLYKPTISDYLSTLALKYLNIKPATKIINHFGIYTNPFNIPISFSSSDIINGTLIEPIIYLDNEEFYQNNHIGYRQIILPKEATKLTSATYTHEITHTLLNNQPGIIKEYYNSEILSIFLELLNLYETKTEENLKLQETIRINDLITNVAYLNAYHYHKLILDENTQLEISKYTVSILKAYQLFIKYYYSSSSYRKYILTSIQSIFDGQLSLEELLSNLDITLTNSINRDLIKYLKR